MIRPCSPCGDGDTAMRYHNHDPLPRSYTLDEIKLLAMEFVDDDSADNFERQLLLSVFIEWLQQREKEGEG